MSPAPASSTSASAIWAVTSSAARAESMKSRCGPASAAGSHRLDRTQRRRLQGRHERNERRHHGGDAAGEQQRGRVETDHAGADASKAVGTGDAPRAWRHRRAEKHIGVGQQYRRGIEQHARHDNAERRSETGKHQALDDELTRDLRAARADRRSHGHLPPLAQRFGDQEIRQIHARDQQHQSDGTEQHQRRTTQITVDAR